MVDKIQKLLAKAENAACTPEEAETFFAKAQELMVANAVDEWQVRQRMGESFRETPVVVVWEYSATDGNLAGKRQILNAVAKANDVRVLIMPTKSGRNHFEATMLGFRSDVEFSQVLYTSCMIQATIASRRGPRLTSAERTGFLMGFGNAVRERLTAVVDAAARTPSTALVLRDRRTEVDDAFRAAFPRTRKMTSRATDGTHFNSGREAGLGADLSGGRGHLGSRAALR